MWKKHHNFFWIRKGEKKRKKSSSLSSFTIPGWRHIVYECSNIRSLLFSITKMENASDFLFHGGISLLAFTQEHKMDWAAKHSTTLQPETAKQTMILNQKQPDLILLKVPYCANLTLPMFLIITVSGLSIRRKVHPLLHFPFWGTVCQNTQFRKPEKPLIPPPG